MAKALTEDVQGWYDNLPPEVQLKLDSAPAPEVIAKTIVTLEDPRQFQMEHWFQDEQSWVKHHGEQFTGCGTTMCMAGWAMHAAGLGPKDELDEERAGMYLLELDSDDAFYSTNEEAFEFIESEWGVTRD